MELPDVKLKVLYDFEYKTKDGKEVKIVEGDKLYLIKKTNEDWWQVIRSSGRPFYVPASYVREISKGSGQSNKKESSKKIDTNQRSLDNPKTRVTSQYRIRSCSVESQNTHDSHKPEVPKRVYNDNSAIFHNYPKSRDKVIRKKNNPPIAEYINLKEEEEEPEYVNLGVEGCSNSVGIEREVEKRTRDGNAESERDIEKRDSHSANLGNDNYSTIKSNAITNKAVGESINLSGSLEKLAQQIEEKTALMNKQEKEKDVLLGSGYSRVTTTFAKPKSDVRSTSNFISEVKMAPKVCEDIPDKSKLQYTGSFKSKHEREKWAKNYVLLCAMKEEDTSVSEVKNCASQSDEIAPNILGKPESKPDIREHAIRENIDKAESQTLEKAEDTKLIRIKKYATKRDAHAIMEKSDTKPDVRISEKIASKPNLPNQYENILLPQIRHVIIAEKINPNASISSDDSFSAPNNESNVSVNSILDKVEVSTSSLEDSNSSNNLSIDSRASSKPGDSFNGSGSASFENSSVSGPDENKKNRVAVKFAQKSNAYASSAEELCNSPANSAHSSISEKGSMDSLLDGETHLSLQDGSLCTTASDSLLLTSETSGEEFSSIATDKPKKLRNVQTKKKRITPRNVRVESSHARFSARSVTPPLPEQGQKPVRQLFSGWREYKFSDDRVFFHNEYTGERSWKPPRKRHPNSREKDACYDDRLGNVYSGSSSPLVGLDDQTPSPSVSPSLEPHISDEWICSFDPISGYQYYTNSITGAKWLTSKDQEGRVYYFEENSNESRWTLPSTDALLSSSNERLDEISQDEEESGSLATTTYSDNNPAAMSQSTMETMVSTPETTSPTIDPAFQMALNRIMKSKSMVMLRPAQNIKTEELPNVTNLKSWPQLWDKKMCVLKEGAINRTKITESGKRLRKNWASSHVVLTELFLLFFKDAKTFAGFKSGNGRPELCVDLNGALIDRGDKISSRKNVFIISTVLGLQVLIQCDCAELADSWLLAIQSAIRNLPSGFDSCPNLTRSRAKSPGSISPEANKKLRKVAREKSIKNKLGSVEDIPGSTSPSERQTKIKARLKKFFHRRPTMESLVKKGIWKDEPAFGCHLEKVAGTECCKVPIFVQRCVACIEKSEENMKTDGLYRASGNLSQVQKIRLQVDQNNLSIIEEEEDVHVLTGVLKLFFRELKEPLIPFSLFTKAIKASNCHSRKEKISQFKDIIKQLPPCNYDTLKFLLQHLIRVTTYKDFNRMHIPNLAIVFGPTLMWPEQESMNMAFDLMQQNLVIECLLLEFDSIFK